MGLLSSFIRSLDDLIAQGYPPEVAERIVSGQLPMDSASRMQRAEAMGFDPTDVQYHGTEADITQFRPSAKGKMGPGVYTTPSPSTASIFSGYPSPYAEGGNVMPLLLRGDYINRADAFDLRPEISGREGQRILNETLEGMGYSGSKAGERGSLAPEKVTFDPRNIRSYLSAAFDPEYTGPNILGATAGTAGALGLLAAPQDAEAGFVTRGGKTLLEAFHGSPHKFDRFSMDAIGTGEGAQAYGHGLYFTDTEDIAKGYRDSLTSLRSEDWSLGDDRVPGWVVEAVDNGGADVVLSDFNRRAADAEKLLAEGTTQPWVREQQKAEAERMIGIVNRLASGEKATAPGALYRTEIDVMPESLLDWDKPLSEQSEVVKGAAQNYFDLFRKDEGIADYLDPIFNDEYEDMTGKEFYQTLQNLYSEDYLEAPIGNTLADDALMRGSIPEATSASLLDDSIRGIQYLDGSSRKAGEGTRNYVMFEDEPIRIAERGSADPRLLAGTAGAGLLGTAFAPDVRSALEEAGVIGDTLVPTKRPLGERAMGVVDRILTGLEVPQRGVQGLAATGYGLLSGENFDTAASRGADVVKQGVEESAREFGDYVFDMTGSPEAATAAYTTGIFGSPL